MSIFELILVLAVSGSAFSKQHDVYIKSFSMKLDNVIPLFERVNPKRFSYHVSVLYKNELRCSGALISPTIVLTCARCTAASDTAEDYTVGFGNVRDPQLLEVLKVKNHPLFNFQTREYDVALVYLKVSAKFTHKFAETIPINPRQAASGSLLTVSGRGMWKYGYPLVKYLQVTTGKAVSRSDCNYTYLVYNVLLPASVRCFGLTEDRKDKLCNIGDIGSPIVQNNTLLGLASWGPQCMAASTIPFIYTSLADPEVLKFIYGFGQYETRQAQ